MSILEFLIRGLAGVCGVVGSAACVVVGGVLACRWYERAGAFGVHPRK